jgi:hypothetical protein
MLLARLDRGSFALLPATAMVGRAQHCDLILQSAHASARHAEIRLQGGGWCVRDLGSRNGTWVDGARLAPGIQAPLSVGTLLQFALPDERWEVLELLPPEPCLFDRCTGEREPACDGQLGALEYDLEAERWCLGEAPVRHGDPVGDRWAFLPEASSLASTIANGLDLASASLRLVASPDLVRIDVHVEGPTESASFLDRAWAIALYVLALERGDGDDPGWVEIERLSRRTGLERKVLDVYLLRARDALLRAGVCGGERIVEVRRGARRLGVRDVRVERATC